VFRRGLILVYYRKKLSLRIKKIVSKNYSKTPKFSFSPCIVYAFEV
jgi:hypothetical protein